MLLVSIKTKKNQPQILDKKKWLKTLTDENLLFKNTCLKCLTKPIK